MGRLELISLVIMTTKEAVKKMKAMEDGFGLSLQRVGIGVLLGELISAGVCGLSGSYGRCRRE